jgi:hypothetical protein
VLIEKERTPKLGRIVAPGFEIASGPDDRAHASKKKRIHHRGREEHEGRNERLKTFVFTSVSSVV